MARRATAIRTARAEAPNFLLLDAGNSLVGDQNPALATSGQSSVEIMNRLAYDAAALGPAELTLSLSELRRRISEADFPLLSANAVEAQGNALVAKPHIVREIAGYRVAIVGLSGGPGTPTIIVRDPLATARDLVAELRDRADVIILLSHAGAGIDQQIADTVPGIALIVSGESPAMSEPFRSQATGAILVRADAASPGHAGRLVGIGDFTFSPEGRLVDHNWRPLPLDPQVADDPEIAAWVAKQER